VRNSFRLPAEKVHDKYQDKFLELKMDLSAKDIFDEKPLTGILAIDDQLLSKSDRKSSTCINPICIHVSL